MRMTPDELGVQAGRHFRQRKVSRLSGHLRVEEHLQQQVAQLVPQLGPVAALDGVEDLVGLLQRMLLDGVEGLFAVPGHPPGPRSRAMMATASASGAAACRASRHSPTAAADSPSLAPGLSIFVCGCFIEGSSFGIEAMS